MATPYTEIYDAFRAKILLDDWDGMTTEELLIDLRALLEGAIPQFKFPRTSLIERDEVGFQNTLEPTEIQILATYMKCEVLSRTIHTWENIKYLYDERDFSQANFLGKLNEMLENERAAARKLEGYFYRSVQGKSFNYGVLSDNTKF